MKKNIFAICDLEADYTRNFAEYLNNRNNIPFDIHAFTTPQSLISFASEHRIELLLISAKAINARIQELDIGKIVVLAENCERKKDGGYSTVYKYQASAQVLKETMAAYSEIIPKEQIFPVLKKNTMIYGIYSPVGGCGKTTLALTMAMELSRRMPTLLLNFEGCSGLEDLLGASAAHTLSDLLYYSHQKDKNLIHRMNSLVQSIEDVDYIPPVRFSEDIRQTTHEDVEYLVQEILSHSTYEALVIDMGNELPEMLSTLDLCGRILIPRRKDAVSDHKIRQFENMLRTLEEHSILEKTVPVQLPDLPDSFYHEISFQQLPWSRIGDYVREFLK